MSSEASNDVVVVGSGAAGLAAAVSAHELGLRPIVLEKAAKLGGQTVTSWGLIWVGSNHIAAREGYADSREDVVEYMRFLGAGYESEPRMLAFVDHSPEALAFYENAGLKLRLVTGLADHYYDKAPGSTAIGRSLEVELVPGEALGPLQHEVQLPLAPYNLTGEELISWGGMNSQPRWDQVLLAERREQDLRGLGVGLVSALLALVVAREIPVRASAAVQELIAEDGRVTGVVLADGERIEARRGVVLASGGYDADPELAHNYDGLPGQISMAPPTNTGDALRMAAAHGAAIKQIQNNLLVMLGFNVAPERASGEAARWWAAGIIEAPSPHTIVVNRAGQRFGNEGHFQYLAPKLREYDPIARTHPNLPCYLVFDGQYAEQFAFAGEGPGELPDFVSRADDLRDLGRKLGVDGAGLEATVRQFNAGVERGVDEAFGRGTEKWRPRGGTGSGGGPSSLGTIAEPPFYGLELHPTFGTSAGLAASVDAQVLRVSGDPITGLYATGNAAAYDELGSGYQAGLTFASGLTFGYLAARHMASA
jgi:3-oxosteroid 1-dehydrogenase